MRLIVIIIFVRCISALHVHYVYIHIAAIQNTPKNVYGMLQKQNCREHPVQINIVMHIE